MINRRLRLPCCAAGPFKNDETGRDRPVHTDGFPPASPQTRGYVKLYHDSSKRAIERPEEESHETKEDNAFERDSMQSENIGRDINAQPQLAQDDSPSLGDKNIPRATQIINLTAVDDILSQVSQQQIVSQDLTQIVDLTTDDEPHSQLSQKPIVSQDSAKGHQSLGERLDITPNRRRRSGGQKRVRDERDSEDDDIAGTTSSTRPAKRPRAASTDSHRVIPKGPDGLPAFEPSALGHNVKESTTSLVPVTDLKTSNQRQLAREIAVPEPVASTEQSHSPLMSKGSKKRSHLESFGSQSGLSEEASAAHKRPKPNVKQNRPDEDRSQAGVVDDTSNEDPATTAKATTAGIETQQLFEVSDTGPASRRGSDVGTAAESMVNTKKRRHNQEDSDSEFESEPRRKSPKTKGRPIKTANKPQEQSTQEARSRDTREKRDGAANRITTKGQTRKPRRFDYVNRDVEPAYPPPVNNYVDFEHISEGPVKEYLLKVNSGMEITAPIHDQYFRAIKDLVLDAADDDIDQAWYMGAFVAVFVNDRVLIDKTEGGLQRATYKALKCLRRARWNIDMAKIFWGTCDYMAITDPVRDQNYQKFKDRLAAKRQAGQILVASEYWLCKKEAGEPMPDLRTIDGDVWPIVAAWDGTEPEDWGQGAIRMTADSLGGRCYDSD